MSTQFGRWVFDDRPLDPSYLEKARTLLAPYGPHGFASFSNDGVHILYCPLHTTKESRKERPFAPLDSGIILTWDGRLDNRADLISLIDGRVSSDSTDADIVRAAFESWGTDCLALLIGDWAISVWNPADRSLILAKDPIGVRHLYYSVERAHITWSTIIDPLVILADRKLTLEYEYIAGWLGMFPATHLTPYAGISSVPPACFVSFKPTSQTLTRYWDFDPAKKVRYATDAEYEEQFRALFDRAVRRRIRSDTPVLAELSGGVDSSSIVCVADALIARGASETPRLDTLSYYDDSEPNWNERPYFTQIENKRGKSGWHIGVNSQTAFGARSASSFFAATPGATDLETEAAKSFAKCRTVNANHVVLSGLGGDEVAGGVPTPIPELADLLAGFHYRALAKQLLAWSLTKKRPWPHLLLETGRSFLPGLALDPESEQSVIWITPRFAMRYQMALNGYESRLKFFGPSPSFQTSLSVLQMLRKQLACSSTLSRPPFELRYPYLDRDLLEFLFAIPRSQLVRPTQRRSLVRRALSGLVPDAILNRRKKAFVVRGPMAEIATNHSDLVNRTQRMIVSSLGIVNSTALRKVLDRVRLGQEVPIVPLIRTFALEDWLMGLYSQKAKFEISPAKFGTLSHANNRQHVSLELADKSSIRPGWM